MELEEIISKQIDYFYKLSTQNIETRSVLRQRLSGNLYRLTNLYETALGDTVNSKIGHKKKYLKTYLTKKAEKIQDKETTNALSEVYAKDESLAEWTQELFAESRRETLKIKIDAVKEVLNCISQIIANLRDERERTKT